MNYKRKIGSRKFGTDAYLIYLDMNYGDRGIPVIVVEESGTGYTDWFSYGIEEFEGTKPVYWSYRSHPAYITNSLVASARRFYETYLHGECAYLEYRLNKLFSPLGGKNVSVYSDNECTAIIIKDIYHPPYYVRSTEEYRIFPLVEKTLSRTIACCSSPESLNYYCLHHLNNDLKENTDKLYDGDYYYTKEIILRQEGGEN